MNREDYEGFMVARQREAALNAEIPLSSELDSLLERHPSNADAILKGVAEAVSLAPPSKVIGYRTLELHEIERINQAKALANRVGELVAAFEEYASADKRWLAIAKTDLQKGFMALVRAIAKPESF